MIDLLFALFLFLGYSPEEIEKMQTSDPQVIDQAMEGLGSTVNGTTTVVLNGTTWEISIDEKGNYTFIKR